MVSDILQTKINNNKLLVFDTVFDLHKSAVNNKIIRWYYTSCTTFMSNHIKDKWIKNSNKLNRFSRDTKSCLRNQLIINSLNVLWLFMQSRIRVHINE